MSHVSGRRKQRPDLDNELYHSKGEANVARILRHLEIKYEREPSIDIQKIAEKYDFRKTETGRLLKQVRPDFYLPDFETYLEVKPAGMDWNDRKRIASVLLHKEQPRLELIMPVTLKLLEQAFRDKIPNWEK